MALNDREFRLLKQIARNTKCGESAGSGPSAGGTINPTVVASATTTIITPSEGDQIRAIEIIPISGGTPGSGTDGLATAEITKADGSVLTFQFRHDMVWNYQGSLNSAPITNIDITNDDGATSFIFILNASSL